MNASSEWGYMYCLMLNAFEDSKAVNHVDYKVVNRRTRHDIGRYS